MAVSSVLHAVFRRKVATQQLHLYIKLLPCLTSDGKEVVPLSAATSNAFVANPNISAPSWRRLLPTSGAVGRARGANRFLLCYDSAALRHALARALTSNSAIIAFMLTGCCCFVAGGDGVAVVVAGSGGGGGGSGGAGGEDEGILSRRPSCCAWPDDVSSRAG